MSRIVSKKLYTRKLSKLLGQTKQRELLIMVWSANSIREGRGEEVGHRLSFPSGALGASPGTELFLAPWTLETLVNEALVHEPAPATASRFLDTRKWESFSNLYNLINSIENSESLDDIEEGRIIDALPRIAWRQFAWQRGFDSSDRFFRSWFLYNIPDANHFMNAAHGISVERFCYVGFAVSSLLRSHPAVLPKTRMNRVGIEEDELDAFFRLSSVSLHAARRECRMSRAGRGQIAYKPSILRRSPLINIFHSNGVVESFCPLPPLLYLRYTDGLFFDLVGNDDVRRQVGLRFEAYARQITSHYLDDSFVLLDEEEYGPPSRRRATPDLRICASNGKLIAVIECKARRIPFRVLSASQPLQQYPSDFSEIVKAVTQIWRYVSDTRQRISGRHLDVASGAIGVVLTLEPWTEMYTGAVENILSDARSATAGHPDIFDCDRIPVTFVAIDDWEYCLRIVDAKGFIAALREHAKPDRVGYLLSYSVEMLEDRNPAGTVFDYHERLSELVPWWNDIRARRIPRRD